MERDYLQRINMDSTWLMALGGTRFLVDPWLTGSETDGFKWLNRQWHVHSVMAPENLPEFDAILITQPYDDHCHIATLRLIHGGKPILADTRAAGKIRRNLKDAQVTVVNEKKKEKVRFGNVELHLSSTDHLYNGCQLRWDDKSLLYLPHGIDIKDKYLRHFTAPVTVALTCASTFTLPFWLGGRVAKGLENVKEIKRMYAPQRIYGTHDEPKQGIGLVSKMAKRHYPTQSEITHEVGPEAFIVETHELLPI